MSAPAINPAPSPTPGPASAAGGSANAPGSQAQGPLAAFEAMLETLFGAKGAGVVDPAAAGAASKTGGKTTGATAAGDSKTAADGKTAADDQAAAQVAAAAGAGANPNLALLVPIVSTQPTAALQGDIGAEAAAGLGATPGADGKSAGLAAATDALAKLAAAAGQADAGQAKTTVQAVVATAAAAASDASATAKVDAALASKIAATPAAPQAPAAPPAPPAASAPPPSPAPAAGAAAAASEAAAALTATQTQGQTQAQTQAQAAAQPRDAGAKDKVQTVKAGTRIDVTKTDAAPGATAALTAKAADALQTIAEGASKGGPGKDDSREPLLETAAAGADEAPAQTPADPATAATTTPATLIHAAAIAVRGAPQTVANLAAQIVKKLDGRSTQFDIQLDPAGLGKVDVRVAIGADGRMTAAMSFDTPQAAAELKSRSAELQQALEQSGFDLSGGMSFDVASDRGQGGQAQHQHQPEASVAFRGRAFQAALDTTSDATPPPQLYRRAARAGVDIRI
jgi:flagellar hook-length control protein FliK